MWTVEEAVSYYKKQGAPADQSALVSLLREIQDHNGGGIPAYMLAPAAEALGTKESYLLAVIKRIPSLRLADTHLLELCAGPNCGKHTTLALAAERLCAKASVELKYIGCQRACAKGPNIKFDGKLYHSADEALLRRLLEECK